MLSIFRILKKSSSAERRWRGTLKWIAASSRISSVVCSRVRIVFYFRSSGQVGHGLGTLYKFAQSCLHGRPGKQLAEDFDLPAQLIIRDGLDKSLCRQTGFYVEFFDLGCGRPRHLQRLALRSDLAHQAHRRRFAGIDATPGEQQVANNRVTEVALQPRYASESGDKPQTEFGKTKARHFVGDDQITGQCQLEAAAEGNTIH